MHEEQNQASKLLSNKFADEKINKEPGEELLRESIDAGIPVEAGKMILSTK